MSERKIDSENFKNDAGVERDTSSTPDDINAMSSNVSNGAQPTNSTPVGLPPVMPVAVDSDQYNMRHPNRGKCLVFNHEVFNEDLYFGKRKGTTLDAEKIDATFTKLGFRVIVHNDLTYSQVIDAIMKLSSENHTDNDCVCIFVLTHGSNNDMIWAKDVAYPVARIWKPFTADNCPTLAGKPKLFFFQACRGDKLDGGITLMPRSGYTQTDSAIASYKIPTHADFLIVHSSVEGFLPRRKPEEGTCYVQYLCSMLEEHAADKDLIQILTITARRIALSCDSSDDENNQETKPIQVPSTTSMLIQSVYFTPK